MHVYNHVIDTNLLQYYLFFVCTCQKMNWMYFIWHQHHVLYYTATITTFMTLWVFQYSDCTLYIYEKTHMYETVHAECHMQVAQEKNINRYDHSHTQRFVFLCWPLAWSKRCYSSMGSIHCFEPRLSWCYGISFWDRILKKPFPSWTSHVLTGPSTFSGLGLRRRGGSGGLSGGRALLVSWQRWWEQEVKGEET